MLSCNDIPEISFVILLFGEDFHRCHKQIIIAKKLLQNEAAERVSKALVFLGIESYYLDWNIETLSGCSRKS
jgi:hypothetical protein